MESLKNKKFAMNKEEMRYCVGGAVELAKTTCHLSAPQTWLSGGVRYSDAYTQDAYAKSGGITMDLLKFNGSDDVAQATRHYNALMIKYKCGVWGRSSSGDSVLIVR